MLLQAAGLALLAAISPTALLIAAIILGSGRPRRAMSYYLAGAVVLSVLKALVFFWIIRAIGLSRPIEHEPRYGLRLALGVVALLAAGFVLLRPRRKPTTEKAAASEGGRLHRLAANPSAFSAFGVGILVYASGVSFLAAVQVIATANASADLTVLAVTLVVVINVVLIWLPLVIYLIAPEWTTRLLTSCSGWLLAHRESVVTVVLVVVGAIMTANGIAGLVAG
jgi:Sap, sulfolipid-1-addressing protein